MVQQQRKHTVLVVDDEPDVVKSVQDLLRFDFRVLGATRATEGMRIMEREKVDIVKIWVDDHLGKDPKIPFDLSKVIIESAHKYHLKVAAHVFYLADAKALVDAGLNGLAHSVRDKPVDDELIQMMKRDNVKVIVVEPYFDLKTPNSIAQAVGGKVLVLLPSVGGEKQVTDYFKLFDYDIDLITKAFKSFAQ